MQAVRSSRALPTSSPAKYTAEASHVCSGVTHFVHTLANEPSLGLHYVSEHINRSVPSLVQSKTALLQSAELLEGAGTDAGLDVEEIMAATSNATQDSLKRAATLAIRAASRAKQ